MTQAIITHQLNSQVNVSGLDNGHQKPAKCTSDTSVFTLMTTYRIQH